MQAKIHIINAVYANDTVKEEANYKRIMSWWSQKSTMERFLKLGFPPGSVEIPEIASREDCWQIGCAGKTAYNWEGLIPKGLAIRNKLITIKNKYSERDFSNDIIIYFDGDEQITFESVYQMVEKLKNCDFVMACRGNKGGISDSRRIVEDFENFIVSESLCCEMPDLQCGCWSFSGKYLDYLLNELSGQGFAIELDLAISMAMKEIYPNYMHISIKDVSDITTTYDSSKMDLEKLKFLMKKLNLSQKRLLTIFQRHLLKKGQILPEQYVVLFSHTEIIRCIGKETYLECSEKKKINNCNSQDCKREELEDWHMCKKGTS